MQSRFPVTRIISGGQTGADRAALDAAREAGCPHGGSLPRGRKTEDGPLPPCYVLRELASGSYARRTKQNVQDSDGTLICSHGALTGGSLLTRQLAENHMRPWLHIDFTSMTHEQAVNELQTWLSAHGIQVLNVAGPRASGDPHIYASVRLLLGRLLQSAPDMVEQAKGSLG